MIYLRISDIFRNFALKLQSINHETFIRIYCAGE